MRLALGASGAPGRDRVVDVAAQCAQHLTSLGGLCVRSTRRADLSHVSVARLSGCVSTGLSGRARRCGDRGGEVPDPLGHRGREPDAAVGAREVGAEDVVGVDLAPVRHRAGDPVEAEAARREAHEVVQPQRPAGVLLDPRRAGRSRSRSGSCPCAARPGCRRCRPGRATRLPAPTTQTQFCLWLITMRRPEPNEPAHGRTSQRRALVANRRVRVAGLQRAGLRQAVAGLEPDDRRPGPGAGLAVDRPGVAVQRVQPALRLRDVCRRPRWPAGRRRDHGRHCDSDRHPPAHHAVPLSSTGQRRPHGRTLVA